MAKVRLKKKVKKIIILLVVGILFLCTSIFLYKDYKYKQSLNINYYKLNIVKKK